MFLVIYLATDNVILATAVAIAGAVGQVIYSRIKGESLGYMTWASLALVIVLGGVTLLTHDPRFVLAKPAIGHIAIGLIMLKRGWMLRYMPPIVTETIPEYVTFAGYAWAALMFRARRRHHRGGIDRRHEIVGDLRVGGADRGQDRGLRGPVCGVPHSGHQPDACSRPRLIAACVGHRPKDALYRRPSLPCPEPFRLCEET